MKRYDAIVIGSGCGMNIVEETLSQGLKVALVDKGPLGGTCPNLGCIPSKILIFAADRIMEIREAARLGISAEIKNIDFNAIMERMKKSIRKSQEDMRRGISRAPNLDFYETEGRFTGDYTLAVKGEEIRGDKIFIAGGSRPLIPPIKGLDGVDYLTSDSVLGLKERPESLIIIGGGYVAVEYGHFFAAIGTKVTILEMDDRLVPAEEPEISALLKEELSKRMDVFTGIQVEEVKENGGNVTVTGRETKGDKRREFKARRVLAAAGRRSNADQLDPKKSGVEVNKGGFIKVDEYMETTRKNIFAAGDINGQQMFTHTANAEAMLAAHNAMHSPRIKMDYNAAPHAVYSHPQIASVGLTEKAARETHEILTGKVGYSSVAQGQAMMEESGFAKAIVEENNEKILGFHIIGPYAPILIQEVINVMAGKGNINHVQTGLHIHPALSELIIKTLNNLEKPS
jgi:dihydrolipoamide dehydrogenase